MFLIETTFNLIQTVTVTLQQFFKPVYFQFHTIFQNLAKTVLHL